MLRFIRSTAMKIIILILILAFAGFCFAFPHKIVTAKNIVVAYYYIHKGDKEYKKSNLVGAINYYNHALALYPQHAMANYNLANIYAVFEDYSNALEHYEVAVKYRPKFMNARIALGILLSEKFFEYDRAISEYQTAIDYAPFKLNIPLIFDNKDYIIYNKAAAYHNMGLAYKWKSLMYGEDSDTSQRNLVNAIDSYRKAIKEDKDSYDSYFNLALGLQLLGNNEEAKKFYCKCITMKPLDYDAHYNMAILLRGEENYLDAMLELEKAALIVDSSSDSYKARYIYDVLNETTSKLYVQQDFANIKEQLNDNPLMNYTPTFVNGKIVASEELDDAIIKNIKTCNACKDYNF